MRWSGEIAISQPQWRLPTDAAWKLALRFDVPHYADVSQGFSTFCRRVRTLRQDVDALLFGHAYLLSCSQVSNQNQAILSAIQLRK
jgi:hypothetical protein